MSLVITSRTDILDIERKLCTCAQTAGEIYNKLVSVINDTEKTIIYNQVTEGLNKLKKNTEESQVMFANLVNKVRDELIESYMVMQQASDAAAAAQAYYDDIVKNTLDAVYSNNGITGDQVAGYNIYAEPASQG